MAYGPSAALAVMTPVLALVAGCISGSGNVHESADRENVNCEIDFDDRIYQGQCENGKANGQGVLEYKNSSDKFVGNFVNDSREGHGTYTWTNGDQYIGEFRNDRKHGQGTLTWADGSEYQGEFNNHKMTGEAIYIFANGGSAKGRFKDKKLVDGWLYKADGNSCEFVNGRFDPAACETVKKSNVYSKPNPLVCREFIEAAYERDLLKVKDFVERRGVDVNCSTPRVGSALYVAMKDSRGNNRQERTFEMAKYLVENGANVNYKFKGESVAFTAAYKGRSKTAAYIVANGGSIDDAKAGNRARGANDAALLAGLVTFGGLVQKGAEAVKKSMQSPSSGSISPTTSDSNGEGTSNELSMQKTGWEKERLSNTRNKIYFDGNLVADISYSFGWKVLCEKRRISGSIRVIDDLDDAIQAAKVECSR